MKNIILFLKKEFGSSTILLIWYCLCFVFFILEMRFFWKTDLLGRDFHLSGFQSVSSFIGTLGICLICALIPKYIYQWEKSILIAMFSMFGISGILYYSYEADCKKIKKNISTHVTEEEVDISNITN